MESRVHDESHAHLHPVHAQVQGFQTSDVAQLEIVAIVVVPLGVAVGEERLSGILGSGDTRLDAVVVGKLIAQVVAVGIAHVAVAVALAFVEWYLGGGHQRVFAVFRNVAQPGPRTLGLFLSCHDEVA